MRRHTTKQPNGADTSASPRPAHREGRTHGSPTSHPPFRPPAPLRRWLWIAGKIVAMVVLMPIEGEGAGCLRTEQAGIFGVLRPRMRHARAAHVAIEADDA